MRHGASSGDAILKMTHCSLAIHRSSSQSMPNDIKSVMTQDEVHSTLQLICNLAN